MHTSAISDVAPTVSHLKNTTHSLPRTSALCPIDMCLLKFIMLSNVVERNLSRSKRVIDSTHGVSCNVCPQVVFSLFKLRNRFGF